MIWAHFIGWLLYAYLLLAIASGPEPPVYGFWKRVAWSVQNMRWTFWALLVLSTVLISLQG